MLRAILNSYSKQDSREWQVKHITSYCIGRGKLVTLFCKYTQIIRQIYNATKQGARRVKQGRYMRATLVMIFFGLGYLFQFLDEFVLVGIFSTKSTHTLLYQ